VVDVPTSQDAKTNKTEVGKGQPEEHTLADGNNAKIKITNNQLDEENNNSAIVMITNNFNAGDLYQIYIPKGGISITQSDVSNLSPSFGTTTFDNSDPNYYVITDKLITAGNISQNINLTLSNTMPGLVSAGSYEKLIDHAFIIKNGNKIGEFDLKIIGKPFTFTVKNGSTIIHVVNHTSGTNLVTQVNPSAAEVITKVDNLVHMKLVYQLPDYYTPATVDVENTVDVQTRQLAHIETTAAMISGRTLTVDFPVDSSSPLRNILTNGQAVNVVLSGTYDIPNSAFNSDNLYQVQLHQPTITLTDQNNYAITHDAGQVNQVVVSSADHLQLGNIIQVDHHYTADYVNDTQSVPGNTVDVDGSHKNQGSGLHADFTPISNIKAQNVVISVQMPDGINVHSLQMSSNRNGIKDLDAAYGIQITYTDGSTEMVSVPANGVITGTSDKSIRSISVKYASYNLDDDLHFTLINGTNFTVAKKYANGDNVQSGGLLVLKATISADRFTPASFKTTDDRLTTYKENDTKGIFMAVVGSNGNQTPGALNAGSLVYEASSSGYGNPDFDHPVMYIQIPDNAIWDQSKPLQIQTGMTSFWGNPKSEVLTPKSVTTINVNGHTFLKVDLSSYTNLKDGFSVIVHYNNGVDFLTSTKYSPFMVVADNLSQPNISWNNHPTADHLENMDKATFETLINQEHIDVSKASYHGSTGTYYGTWKINTAAGTTVATMTQGNTDSGPSLAGKQDVNGTDPTHFTVYGSIVNADQNTKIDNATQVINLPSTSDGKSGFTPVLTGPVTLTDPNTATDLSDDATITYYTDRADLSQGADSLAGKTGLLADQVTDWSKIKAIKVVFNKHPLENETTARVTMKMVDDHIYDHVGKTIYASSVIYSTSMQGESLPKVVVNAGDPASASLTVVGQAKVKTIVHYVSDGVDHYVELPDKTVTYDEGNQTMNRNDFLTKDSDLSVNDHMLLPEHMVLDYAHPTIKNSNATYLNNYPNDIAQFGQTVKYYFDGDAVVFEGKVAQKITDSHQVTETIHFEKADGTKVADDVVKKSNEFQRIGYQNPFTGDKVWATTTETYTLPEVTSPTVPGYTATITSVPAVTVDPTTADIVKKVIYTANDQTTHVVYVDKDGNTVKTDKVSGKTDETVPSHSTVPTGWKLVDGQTVPTDITFTGESTPDTKVVVEHVIDHISHDTPVPTDGKTPTDKPIDGAHDTDLNQTITRTINTTDQYGHKTTVVQTAKLYRDADVDEVTGKVTYGSWSTDDVNWTTVAPSSIAGYTTHITTDGTASIDIPAITVKDGQKNVIVDVTYAANDHETKLSFQDDDGQTVGNPVTVAGKTGETKKIGTDYQMRVPAGWELDNDQTVPTEIVFGADGHTDIVVKIHHGHTNVPHTQPVQPGDKTPAGTPIDGATDHDLNQTITRTITTTVPGGQPTTITQTAKIYRDATIDNVTGAVTYTDWSMDGTDWAAVVPSDIAGYTAHIATDGTASTSIPAVTVKDGQKDVKVFVTYTANDQSVKINYVDKDGNNVHTDMVSGKTDQTVPTNSTVPTGWKLTDGQPPVPTDITFTGTPTSDIDIVVEHVIDHIPHDKPVPADGKTSTGKSIDGAHENDLNQTITRTIQTIDQHGNKTTVVQTAKIYRDANVDEVTGKVTYGPWSTDNANWTAVVPSSIAGYTTHITTDGAASTDIPAVMVKDGQKNVKVNVTYTPDEHSGKISYVDGQGHEINSTPLTGKTDETIQVKPQVPAGWKIVPGQEIPTTEQVTADGIPTVTIHVEHATTTVQPTDPKTPADTLPDNPTKNYPAGVAKDDLNKTITRTIILHLPDGSVRTIHQEAHLSRTATVDEVTRQVTYGQWTTADWPEYDVPAIGGYTASQTTVSMAKVMSTTSPVTVDVYYHALLQAVNGQSNGAEQATTTTRDKQRNQQLPQTGNHDSRAALGLGVSALLMMIGLLGGQHRQDED
jgi:hypothetical protein